MLSLFPYKNAGLVGLLRLGKILALFSYVLLLVSGVMRMAIGLQVLALSRLAVTLAAILFAVFVLDLLFLAVLLAWRAEEAPRAHPAVGADLAEYAETEAQDFH
jgi:hypothetical protein